jgi:hypothetical protein
VVHPIDMRLMRKYNCVYCFWNVVVLEIRIWALILNFLVRMSLEVFFFLVFRDLIGLLGLYVGLNGG